jgi:hypothetical protein
MLVDNYRLVTPLEQVSNTENSEEPKRSPLIIDVHCYSPDSYPDRWSSTNLADRRFSILPDAIIFITCWCKEPFNYTEFSSK